jgi:hypothetical protein
VSGPDGRVPLAPKPGDEHDWTYLQPVVDAETSWGNEADGGFRAIGHGDGWTLTFRHALHVDRLREMFEFPDFVTLVDLDPVTSVVDTRFPYQEIAIHAAIPPGWIRGDSPSGYVRDDRRSSRFVRRLLGVKGGDR